MRRVLLALAFLVLIGRVHSQGETPNGVLIREGNINGEQVTILNPLLCNVDPACIRSADLLFPRLLNIDPQTGWLTDSNDSALVESWETDAAGTILRLRSDARWSDGQPITAYDVVFSFLASIYSPMYGARLERTIEAVDAINPTTVRLSLYGGVCTAATALDIPIIPAHAFVVDFAALVDARTAREWFIENDDFYFNHPFNRDPYITGGTFRLAERRFNEAINLRAVDGTSAYSFIDVWDKTAAVNRFLAGETNLLIDPPFNRRRDIRSHPGAHTIAPPSDDALFILLDRVRDDDPRMPHPIFADRDVRRTMQMALDGQALMDIAIEGDGTILASSAAPSALGYDPALVPVEYDPIHARQLLHDAGWRDTNSDGVRECVNCANAAAGTRLSFTMSVLLDFRNPDFYDMLLLLEQQFNAVGVQINIIDETFQSPSDVWLTSTFMLSRVGIAENELFTAENTDPEVVRLHTEADDPALCGDPARRRALYQEAQALLAADQPALWLFSPNRMIAFRDNIDRYPDLWEILTR